MSTFLIRVAGLVLAASTTLASAAIISLPFTVEVENVTGSTEGVAVGDRFDGTIRYEESELIPDGLNFITGPVFEIDFAFNRGANFSPPELVPNGAIISSSGELLGLNFSIDVPNDFFFSAGHMGFSFEYSRLVDDGDGGQMQVTLGRGNGVILARANEVFAPATLWLSLPLVAMLMVRRRS